MTTCVVVSRPSKASCWRKASPTNLPCLLVSVTCCWPLCLFQVGGENGSVLVWDVQQDCLLFDIPAHEGKVWDCSWSGDSRRLLSVGSDGQAKLWDTTAGSELVKVCVLRCVQNSHIVRCACCR